MGVGFIPVETTCEDQISTTPLPPLKKSKDTGKFVLLWKQEVSSYDEVGLDWVSIPYSFHMARLCDVGAEASVLYYEMYSRHVNELVLNLSKATGDLQKPVQVHTASLIMAVTYGHTDLGAQDPFLACAQELLDIARHLLSPERAAMFAAFPFLKRLPVWCFHGAYALMGCSRELCHQLLDEPFNEVKAQMANGTTSQSLVADFLSQADNDADKDMMKAVALMGCIGGIDTSTSTLQVFLMAMLLYPDVQARARGSVMCLDDN
ncbi:hypothetical protein F4604DRAFT_2021269 [Suillus subluteus]|nr:hypothetical protein F4604DRAFT_2021269 [Suillus subluteus]